MAVPGASGVWRIERHLQDVIPGKPVDEIQDRPLPTNMSTEVGKWAQDTCGCRRIPQPSLALCDHSCLGVQGKEAGKFKASLGYLMSSRLAWTTQQDYISIKTRLKAWIGLYGLQCAHAQDPGSNLQNWKPKTQHKQTNKNKYNPCF